MFKFVKTDKPIEVTLISDNFLITLNLKLNGASNLDFKCDAHFDDSSTFSIPIEIKKQKKTTIITCSTNLVADKNIDSILLYQSAPDQHIDLIEHFSLTIPKIATEQEKLERKLIDLIDENVDERIVTFSSDFRSDLNQYVDSRINESSDVLRTEIQTDIKKQLALKKYNHTEIEGLEQEIINIVSSLTTFVTQQMNTLKASIVNDLKTIIDSNTQIKNASIYNDIVVNKKYIHIVRMESYPDPEKPTDKFLWIKMVTNHLIDSTRANGKLLLIQNEDELRNEPYNISIQKPSGSAIKFNSCVFIPAGPKNVMDFPVGNKLFEYLENEIHIQYRIPATFETELMDTKRIEVMYKNVKVNESFIMKYDNSDWSHYYGNMMNGKIM